MFVFDRNLPMKVVLLSNNGILLYAIISKTSVVATCRIISNGLLSTLHLFEDLLIGNAISKCTFL